VSYQGDTSKSEEFQPEIRTLAVVGQKTHGQWTGGVEHITITVACKKKGKKSDAIKLGHRRMEREKRLQPKERKGTSRGGGV